MSGGVDSSTAAALLKTQGMEVIGVGLKFSACDAPISDMPTCCGFADMRDARAVAERIGFPFYVLDAEQAFAAEVIEPFCRAYLNGKTPNPCIECNRALKFGRLLEYAGTLGACYLATGHYARITRDAASGRLQLCKGIDAHRDQSYFLYPLTQAQLSRLLFPLGEMTKEETRTVARTFDLPVSEKAASQDICFVASGSYRTFVAERYPQAWRRGQIVNVRGEVLGAHDGIAGYTVGQRRGLGVSARQPLYVLAIDAAQNRVIAGTREEARRERITVTGMHWISGVAPGEPFAAKVKIRYRQPETEATLHPVGTERVEVKFREPQVGPAPGQAAVFYDGDVVIGGGTIE